MGIKQLYNDNLRKLPNKYGHVSVMDNLDELISKKQNQLAKLMSKDKNNLPKKSPRKN